VRDACCGGGGWLHSLSQQASGQSGVEIEEPALGDDVTGDCERRGPGGGGEAFAGELQTDLAPGSVQVRAHTTELRGATVAGETAVAE